MGNGDFPMGNDDFPMENGDVCAVVSGGCPPPEGSTKPRNRVLDQRMFVRAIFWHSVKKIKSKNVKVLCKGSHDKRMQKALSSGGVMIKKLEL